MLLKPLLITVKETASLLRIQRAKVYLLIETGTLEAVKIGSAWRVRVDSIEALVGKISVPSGDKPDPVCGHALPLKFDGD
jgi:excisionase family DNA binding protein